MEDFSHTVDVSNGMWLKKYFKKACLKVDEILLLHVSYEKIGHLEIFFPNDHAISFTLTRRWIRRRDTQARAREREREGLRLVLLLLRLLLPSSVVPVREPAVCPRLRWRRRNEENSPWMGCSLRTTRDRVETSRGRSRSWRRRSRRWRSGSRPRRRRCRLRRRRGGRCVKARRA